MFNLFCIEMMKQLKRKILLYVNIFAVLIEKNFKLFSLPGMQDYDMIQQSNRKGGV